MSLTITPNPSGAGIRPLRMMGNDDVKVVFTTFEWDDSYPTSGETVEPSSVGLNEILYVFPAMATSGDIFTGLSGIDAKYDVSNKKLVAYCAGVEVADGVSLASYKTHCIIVGY